MGQYVVGYIAYTTEVIEAETEEAAMGKAREIVPGGWHAEQVEQIRLIAELLPNGEERQIDGAPEDY